MGNPQFTRKDELLKSIEISSIELDYISALDNGFLVLLF
jgi:hypothetical protein